MEPASRTVAIVWHGTRYGAGSVGQFYIVCGARRSNACSVLTITAAAIFAISAVGRWVTGRAVGRIFFNARTVFIAIPGGVATEIGRGCAVIRACRKTDAVQAGSVAPVIPAQSAAGCGVAECAVRLILLNASAVLIARTGDIATGARRWRTSVDGRATTIGTESNNTRVAAAVRVRLTLGLANAA